MVTHIALAVHAFGGPNRVLSSQLSWSSCSLRPTVTPPKDGVSFIILPSGPCSDPLLSPESPGSTLVPPLLLERIDEAGSASRDDRYILTESCGRSSSSTGKMDELCDKRREDWKPDGRSFCWMR